MQFWGIAPQGARDAKDARRGTPGTSGASGTPGDARDARDARDAGDARGARTPGAPGTPGAPAPGSVLRPSTVQFCPKTHKQKFATHPVPGHLLQGVPIQGASFKVEEAHFAACKKGPEIRKDEVKLHARLCRPLKHSMNNPNQFVHVMCFLFLLLTGVSRAPSGPSSRNRKSVQNIFLLPVGGFLLTVELFLLAVVFGSFLLTVGTLSCLQFEPFGFFYS